MSKRKLVFQPSIFMSYVSFREGYMFQFREESITQKVNFDSYSIIPPQWHGRNLANQLRCISTLPSPNSTITWPEPLGLVQMSFLLGPGLLPGAMLLLGSVVLVNHGAFPTKLNKLVLVPIVFLASLSTGITGPQTQWSQCQCQV